MVIITVNTIIMTINKMVMIMMMVTIIIMIMIMVMIMMKIRFTFQGAVMEISSVATTRRCPAPTPLTTRRWTSASRPSTRVGIATTFTKLPG